MSRPDPARGADPAARRAGSDRARGSGPGEPAGRTVLRLGFGALWVLDGILQA